MAIKNLYIVGAGGCGRELLGMLIDAERIKGKRWNIVGFLDDTKTDLKDLECPFPVMGTIQDFYPKPDDALMLGIASPSGKKKVASLLKARGAHFETFIHPYASLGHYNKIGEGCLLYGGFGMTVNVNIGDFVTLQTCYLGHDVHIGNYSTVSSFCNLMGYAAIGQEVFLGSNVAVAPHVKVGDNAYLCLGSIVACDISPNAKAMGNPAREIG